MDDANLPSESVANPPGGAEPSYEVVRHGLGRLLVEHQRSGIRGRLKNYDWASDRCEVVILAPGVEGCFWARREDLRTSKLYGQVSDSG